MREKLRKGIVDYFCRMAEVQMAEFHVGLDTSSA